MTNGADGSQDARFVGSIPEVYESLLVPMIFHAPAVRLAGLVAADAPADVLETAAGTGALTRELLATCSGATITATDLNQPMLSSAAEHSPTGDRVNWQQADALDLPFADDSFDAVVCQFGVMFFPDRVAGYREALRVLRPGGLLAFNTWDRIENNLVPHVVEEALAAAAPDNPIRFMSRTPHGYFSPEQVLTDLEAAGLGDVRITAVDGTSSTKAADAATAFCQGTPLRVALDNHPTLTVPDATRTAQDALVERFGTGHLEAPIRWFEVAARALTR